MWTEKPIKVFNGVTTQERSAGNSNSGVFITTSSYTQDALISAKRLHIKVIDGEQLAKLIIKYKVGIKTINQFPVYEINKEAKLEKYHGNLEQYFHFEPTDYLALKKDN